MKSLVFICMRRLAISSWFLLTACSGGDLSVKTDLDETYSVIESAVSVEPINDWSRHRSKIAQSAQAQERLKESYRELINAYQKSERFDDAIDLLSSDEYKK